DSTVSPVRDPRDGKPPHPGNGKTILYSKRAGEQRRGERSNHRKKGNARMAQRVFQEDGALGNAFRPRRADKILAQSLDQGRAQQSGEISRRRRAQSDGRKHRAAPLIPSPRLEPAEL